MGLKGFRERFSQCYRYDYFNIDSRVKGFALLPFRDSEYIEAERLYIYNVTYNAFLYSTISSPSLPNILNTRLSNHDRNFNQLLAKLYSLNPRYHITPSPPPASVSLLDYCISDSGHQAFISQNWRAGYESVLLFIDLY